MFDRQLAREILKLTEEDINAYTDEELEAFCKYEQKRLAFERQWKAEKEAANIQTATESPVNLNQDVALSDTTALTATTTTETAPVASVMTTEPQHLKTVEDVEEELQNVQIYPATERVEINDKFTKIAFSRIYKGSTPNNQIRYGVIEKRNHTSGKGKYKTTEKLVTNYYIYNENGDDEISLTEFDRAVLSAIISEQKAGNVYTTVNIIFRALIGKVGDQNVRPMKNLRDAIANSVDTLRHTDIDFKNLDETLTELGYIKNEKECPLKKSAILPAQWFACKINGQPVEDVIYFNNQSPLLWIAEKKNQIIRYPAELLNIPNQRNTPLIIMLKTYVLRRIAEIKLHKQLTPTITFDDVFQKCRLTNASRHKKLDAREAILQLFEHLKTKKYITDYEVLKRGVPIYGVSFQK